MKKEHFNLYIIAEMNYMKKYFGLSPYDLFPLNWYEIKDYKLKTKIISEAIKNNILIKDTNLYQEHTKQIHL